MKSIIVSLCIGMASIISMTVQAAQINTGFVQELIQHAKGSACHNPEIADVDEILALLDRLDADKTVSARGSDDLRVKYVHAQGVIEHALCCALALGKIQILIGVIHTPQPATPLCTAVDNLDEQLLDISIRHQMDKLLTVRSRAVILRDFLQKGGILYIAYPKGGLEKRTEGQQTIYKQELLRYPGSLIDIPLNCTTFDPEKVGATYLFKTIQGQTYAFSIKSRQANNPSDDSEWVLWLGDTSHPAIQRRMAEITDYLIQNGGPDITAFARE